MARSSRYLSISYETGPTYRSGGEIRIYPWAMDAKKAELLEDCPSR